MTTKYTVARPLAKSEEDLECDFGYHSAFHCFFAGFILFVLNLKKEHYKVQFSLVNITCFWVSFKMYLEQWLTQASESPCKWESYVFSLKIPCIFYLQSMNFVSKSLNTQNHNEIPELLLQNCSTNVLWLLEIVGILGSNCKWDCMCPASVKFCAL